MVLRFGLDGGCTADAMKPIPTFRVLLAEKKRKVYAYLGILSPKLGILKLNYQTV